MKRGVLDLIYDPVDVSVVMAVGVDTQHGKAEFKVQHLENAKSVPPVDSANILPSRYNTKYFIHYPTAW